MYKPGTILELKEQRPPSEKLNRDGDTITDENDEPIQFEFPYNRVRVIGESPIDHALTSSGWEGSGARGVIIQPMTDFAGNLDEPFGKLQKLYNVVEIPEQPVIRPEVRVTVPADLGPTPEEVFAEKAPGTPPEPGRKRGRTPHTESPLGEVDVEEELSPLPKAKPPARKKPKSDSPL